MHRSLIQSPALTTAASAVLLLTACADPAPTRSAGPRTGASTAIVDPAALYCSGTGGTVIERVANGRRADLCRLPDGRTVRAADLINSHNDL